MPNMDSNFSKRILITLNLLLETSMDVVFYVSPLPFGRGRESATY